MSEFDNRIGIVTGGTRGIGRAVVLDLARRGAKVAFTYNSRADLAQELEQTTARLGHRAVGYRVDSADFQAVRQTLAEVRSHLGEIDFLVNNAGITRDKLLMTMSPEDWRAVIDVNLDGVFNFSRAVVVGMMKAKRGSIVNVASVSGVSGAPGQTGYSASKAGVIGFTKALARETARIGVRVNALALGFFETDMTAQLPEKIRGGAMTNIPMARFGQVDEAAFAVAFLLSDKASYITGHVLHVDGGLAA